MTHHRTIAVMLLACTVALTARAQPQQQPAAAALQRDYRAELRTLLKSGLTEAQISQSSAARQELQNVDDLIDWINGRVLADATEALAEQLAPGEQPHIDISLLWDNSGQHAKPIQWAIAHEAMRRYSQMGVLMRLQSIAAAPRLAMWEVVPDGSGYDTTEMLESLGRTRRAAQALATSARLRAQAGDRPGAIEDIQAIISLGGAMSQRPSLMIDSLVGASITALGVHTVRNLLRDGSFDAESLLRLGKMMDESLRIPDRSGSIEASTIESLMGLDVIIQESAPLFRSIWRKQAEDAARTYRDECLRVAALPRPERLAATLDPAIILKNHRRVGSPINEMIFEQPKPDIHIRNIDQLESESRGIRLMVAIEAFRAARGHPPASLDDLIPDFIAQLPTDPYAPDARHRYILFPAQGVHPATYTLYSVGFDGIDDGGAFPIGEEFYNRYDATSGSCTNCDFPISEP
jgi:hypothetical protein